jgi:hypothetical protein
MRNKGRGQWYLTPLENRTAPAAFNTLSSRSEPTLFGDTAGGNSYFENPNVNVALPARDVSADGRYVAFLSAAQNVVAGQVDNNGTDDLFLNDCVANTTVLISGQNGSATVTGNGVCANPAISADGRYVTFTSKASNLIPGFVATTGTPANVYLYDRFNSTCTLVCHQSGSLTGSASIDCTFPIISANGQVVVFTSTAVNLISGFPNPGGGNASTYAHAYAFDVSTGAITLLDHKYGSVSDPATGTGGPTAVTPDGQYIVVNSNGPEMNSVTSTSKGDTYRYDRQTGINQLISRASNVAPFGGNGRSSGSTISADGQWVGMISAATNLVPGAASSGTQLLLANTVSGSILLASHASSNSLAGGNGASGIFSMTPDGSYLAFRSQASNLVGGFVNGNTSSNYNFYLYDRAANQVTLVNHNYGVATTSGNAASTAFSNPQITPDGRYVLFADNSTDLVAGFVDQNGPNYRDLYLFDRTTGLVTLVSGKNNSATIGGIGETLYGAFSADGSYVVMSSAASDLTSSIADTNGSSDVFLRNMTTGATTLVSRRFDSPSLSPGGNGNWVNQTPDGRFVVYQDTANNIVSGQINPNQTYDVFLLDRSTGTTTLVSHTAGSPTIAANADSLWPVISADGKYVAYASQATDLVTGFIDNNGPPGNGGSTGTDVFVYDRLAGTNQLVSRKAGMTNVGGNGTSGILETADGSQLSISDDGHWIVFRSQATDLINGFVDNNGNVVGNGIGSDVFLFDRVNGTNALVSHLPECRWPRPTARASPGPSAVTVVMWPFSPMPAISLPV